MLNVPQGLRGLAAQGVVLTHIASAFYPHLHSPTSAYGSAPTILQLPGFRILFTGQLYVSLFFVLSGYTCSLKPLKLVRLGQREEALISLSSSAFLRFWRLAIPAAAATMLSMLLSQIGAYHIAREFGSEWLTRTVPPFFYNPIMAILCFLKNLIWTWTLSHNQYEKTQWSLAQELSGSIVLYAVLLPGIRLIRSWRLLLLAICAIWYFREGNRTVG